MPMTFLGTQNVEMNEAHNNSEQLYELSIFLPWVAQLMPGMAKILAKILNCKNGREKW